MFGRKKLLAEIERLQEVNEKILLDPEKHLIKELVVKDGHLDAIFQSPIAVVIGTWAHEMLKSAPNFVTCTLNVNDPEERHVKYEITVKRWGAQKTPADRIAELEAEVERLQGGEE